MKKLFLICFITVTSTSHAFSLDQAKSIECSDLSKNAEMHLFFTTSNYGAEKYLRRANAIPYSYGNLRVYTSKTGQMTLKNNPDNEGGIVLLFEDDGFDLSSIELRPTVNPNLFDGFLSGNVEDLNNNWVPIDHYKLACTIEFF